MDHIQLYRGLLWLKPNTLKVVKLGQYRYNSDPWAMLVPVLVGIRAGPSSITSPTVMGENLPA